MKLYINNGILMKESAGVVEGHLFEIEDDVVEFDIPEGINGIAPYILRNLKNIRRVWLPESMKTIGQYAFAGCEALEEISIPETVTCIEDAAFSGCAKLVEIVIPASVTSIESCAFQYCMTLKRVELKEGLKKIGSSAFDGCQELACIELPDSVEELGSSAFDNCEKLKSIRLSRNLSRIEAYTFRCSALKNVVIPQRVKQIDYRGISDCNELRSIELPEGIEKIHLNAFEDDLKLEELIISDGKGGYGAWNPLLSKPIRECPISRLHVADIAAVPPKLRQAAVMGFVEDGGDAHSPRGENHLKYIRSNAAKLITAAFDYPALFRLMCEEKLIPPKLIAVFAAEARQRGDEAALALLGMPEINQDDVQKARELKAEVKAKIRRTMYAVEMNDDSIMVYTTKDEARKNHFFFGPMGFLGNVGDLFPKWRMDASLGMLWLEVHGRDDMDPWRESYVEFLRADKKRAIEILKYNLDYLFPMIRLNMIPVAALRQILKIVEEEGNAEHMAALLDYERHIGLKAIENAEASAARGFERQLQNLTEGASIKAEAGGLAGLSFVQTGDMPSFDIYHDEYTGAADQAELKAFIEARGGHLRASVSGKTNYLIAQNPDGDSAKLRKARELGIEIISEEQFLKMAGLKDKQE